MIRAFIALKNDDITLNKLHTKVCKTPCKHTTEDLSVLVQKSSLFNIKSGNIIRVVSSLKIGGFLLDLACNTKKEACSDSENYSLINRNQVIKIRFFYRNFCHLAKLPITAFLTKIPKLLTVNFPKSFHKYQLKMAKFNSSFEIYA